MNTPYAGNQFPPRENETNACDEAFVSSPFLRAQNRNRNPVAPTERGRHSVCLHTNSIKKNRWTQMLIMKKILLTLAILTVAGVGANAQTVVFSDNFNRADSTTVGNNWVETAGEGNASISSNKLEIVGTGSNGRTYVTQAMSNFSSPWNTTLSSNSGLVSWSFNMRSNRDNLAGFDSNTYGIAFVLATTSSDITLGDGYAVVWGQSGGVDPVRLVRYSGGLDLDSNITDMIVGTGTPFSDMGTRYLSLQVTYAPITNTWELFLRDDGASAFADPLVGSLTSQSTVVDSTHTGKTMTSTAAFWNHGTSATDLTQFDNVVVSVVPEPVTCALFGAGALLWVLRRKRTV